MRYELKSGVTLDMVALKVKDIEKEIAFYKEVLKLDVLREENGIVYLGIAETRQPLVSLLEKQDGKMSQVSHNGLFHFAIVLPTQQLLAEFYQSLLEKDYPIKATNDLGHSQAIYIQDPEFNGIKIYFDKPEDEWPLTAERTLDSLLNHLDTNELTELAKDPFEKMPKEAAIGHVHLSVSDLEKSQQFYTEILGLNLQSLTLPGVRYLGIGDYHQHIGMNTWHQVEERDMNDANLGLDYLSFILNDHDELLSLKNHLTKIGQAFYFNQGKKVIQLDDPNGIHIWLHTEKEKI